MPTHDGQATFNGVGAFRVDTEGQAYTRFGLAGYGERPSGSFVGKLASTTGYISASFNGSSTFSVLVTIARQHQASASFSGSSTFGVFYSPERFTDDNSEINFVDDNGVTDFIDDLGNYTYDSEVLHFGGIGNLRVSAALKGMISANFNGAGSLLVRGIVGAKASTSFGGAGSLLVDAAVVSPVSSPPLVPLLTAGTGFYIGGVRVGTEFVLADFAGESWIPVGWVESLGSLGDESNSITYEAIGVKRIFKRKGQRNSGDMIVVCGVDYQDVGQFAIREANSSLSSYAFRLVFNDAPEFGTPSERYFVGLVLSAREGLATANSVVKLTAAIGVTSNITRVDATT